MLKYIRKVDPIGKALDISIFWILGFFFAIFLVMITIKGEESHVRGKTETADQRTGSTK